MSQNVNGLKAVEVLRTFLEEDGWYPRQKEAETIFYANYRGHNGRYSCEARLRVEAEIFLFYVGAPLTIPPENRLTVSEFITRVNYGMRIGNMEMNMSSGKVRYKSSLDFRGEKLTSMWLKNSIVAAVTAMDRYLPGLKAIVDDDISAADAHTRTKKK